MASQDDDGMQDLVNQVAAKCVLQLREERAIADQNQLEQINQLLEHWSEQAFQKTKELVSKASIHSEGQSNGASNDAFAGTSADIRERQSNLLAVSHSLVCSYVCLYIFLTQYSAIYMVVGHVDCPGLSQQAARHFEDCDCRREETIRPGTAGEQSVLNAPLPRVRILTQYLVHLRVNTGV